MRKLLGAGKTTEASKLGSEILKETDFAARQIWQTIPGSSAETPPWRLPHAIRRQSRDAGSQGLGHWANQSEDSQWPTQTPFMPEPLMQTEPWLQSSS